jgi:arabinogalactan oligomer/maltooligosaccharide transport system permease protein
MNIGGLTSAAIGDRLTLVLMLIVVFGSGILLLEAIIYTVLAKVIKTRHALAFTLLAPAVIALAFFTVYPLFYNFQLAFSDLRLKTLPCYTASGSSTAVCPMSKPEAGKTARISIDSLTLYADAGDDAKSVGTVKRDATVSVLQSGPSTSAAPAQSGGAGTGSGGGFDLGGGSSDTSGAGATPTVVAPVTDSRTWWQIKTSDGITGWVPEFLTANPDSPTLTQEPVLYSLDYGLKNFRDVFFDVDSKTGQITGWGRLIRTEGSTFPVLLARTFLWTILNVFFHLVIGFSLALLLNGKLRGKSIYRMIILIPWAIPQVIAALTWRSEFQSQYGFVNAMLKQFGIAPVPWLTQPIPAFIAVVFVNIWLGVPFYMVVLLGGLGSISREYYEAAEMDGSSVVQRFWAITVPLIRPIAVPIITLDAIWTFNMFNVIYLITGGEPNESTNILVTALYNAAFGPNGTYRLGFAAAFSILNFLLLLVLATFWVRSSGALKRVDE